MDVPLSGRLTVSELLADHPRALSIFLQMRTVCVGCHLARFCTLEDVARTYEMPLHEFLKKLHKTAQSSKE
jgi:hybrid cluster-associated redox disulfide protein